MKTSVCLVLACFIVVSLPAAALSQTDIRDPRLFKKFNPDGGKYKFVRDYLESLRYLAQNAENDAAVNEKLQDKGKSDQVKALTNNLIQNNFNLRIARNYLNHHNKDKKNGLILLATDQFKQVCDRLIDLNNKERALLEDYSRALKEGKGETFDLKQLAQNREAIQVQRKEAGQFLLETSVLVGKILVSNKQNYFGEFDTLGITQEERYALLRKLDEFKGKAFEGKARAGQTFLEASISTIRQILENYRYAALDG